MRKSIKLLFFISCLWIGASGQGSTDGITDAITQMGEDEIQNIQEQAGQIEDVNNHLAEGLEMFNDFVQTAQSASDLYNSSQALDNDECIPDFTTNAEAMMPSGCDEDPGCAGCYEQAINRLSTVRRSLARMSCIRMNTKKFTESAIAFGDNVAGLHGAMGLAWQAERKGIEKAYDNFKRTYDRKYTDLMNSLSTALQQINQCEAKFGMRDWYQKAGFMYFEMMKEKYKRTD